MTHVLSCCRNLPTGLLNEKIPETRKKCIKMYSLVVTYKLLNTQSKLDLVNKIDIMESREKC